jgi:hypothetical protein
VKGGRQPADLAGRADLDGAGLHVEIGATPAPRWPARPPAGSPAFSRCRLEAAAIAARLATRASPPGARPRCAARRPAGWPPTASWPPRPRGRGRARRRAAAPPARRRAPPAARRRCGGSGRAARAWDRLEMAQLVLASARRGRQQLLVAPLEAAGDGRHRPEPALEAGRLPGLRQRRQCAELPAERAAVRAGREATSSIAALARNTTIAWSTRVRAALTAAWSPGCGWARLCQTASRSRSPPSTWARVAASAANLTDSAPRSARSRSRRSPAIRGDARPPSRAPEE